jgi:hypothetical protein
MFSEVINGICEDVLSKQFKQFVEFLDSTSDKQLNYMYVRKSGKLFQVWQETDDDTIVELWLTSETAIRFGENGFSEVIYNGVMSAQCVIEYLNIGEFRFEDQRVTIVIEGIELVLYHY